MAPQQAEVTQPNKDPGPISLDGEVRDGADWWAYALAVAIILTGIGVPIGVFGHSEWSGLLRGLAALSGAAGIAGMLLDMNRNP